jgi:hypothetical protein
MDVETNWLNNYYSQLEGSKIIKFELNWDEDGEEFWPTFYVELKDGTNVKLELSSDEEGNGPGFLFGLEYPADWPPVYKSYLTEIYLTEKENDNGN